MTRRAKLSLDPDRRNKTAPPHGFDGDSADAEAAAVPVGTPAAAADGIADAKRAAGHWRADRSAPEQDAHAVPAAAEVPYGVGSAIVATVKVLARKPAVRTAGVAVLAGLSLYLLGRRLF
jgi:hypothetical protein